jgi:hypothetical protein
MLPKLAILIASRARSNCSNAVLDGDSQFDPDESIRRAATTRLIELRRMAVHLRTLRASVRSARFLAWSPSATVRTRRRQAG